MATTRKVTNTTVRKKRFSKNILLKSQNVQHSTSHLYSPICWSWVFCSPWVLQERLQILRPPCSLLHPFTVFAPTNAAFAKLPADLVTAVTSDTELLKTVLLYHVVPGKITSDKVTNGAVVSTVEGSSVRASVTKNNYYGGSATIKINDSKVVKADVMASNGVIHFIDSVLLPPTASA